MICEQLKVDIESYASRLRASQLFGLAKQGEITPAAMAEYVANLRLLVFETDGNLRLAEARAKELGRPDLAAFFARKRGEEVGHERWADHDISRLRGQFGVNRDVGSSPAIGALLEYLREVIREEPVNYLAYMLLAEYVTVLVGPEFLALLDEHCGIPPTSLTVIGHHVELDREHVAEGLEQIGSAVTDVRWSSSMRETLSRSMEYFDRFWGEICEVAHDGRGNPAVA
jgi:hypothetical protein